MFDWVLNTPMHTMYALTQLSKKWLMLKKNIPKHKNSVDLFVSDYLENKLIHYPLNVERKFNIHKTSRRRWKADVRSTFVFCLGITHNSMHTSISTKTNDQWIPFALFFKHMTTFSLTFLSKTLHPATIFKNFDWSDPNLLLDEIISYKLLHG